MVYYLFTTPLQKRSKKSQKALGKWPLRSDFLPKKRKKGAETQLLFSNKINTSRFRRFPYFEKHLSTLAESPEKQKQSYF